MSSTYAKISCLMVTLDRLELLKNSVQRFCAQTYPNKELVIVTDGSQESQHQLRAYLEGLQRAEIKFVGVQQKQTLGALRNIAVSEAAGELLCQWDDDDLHHPRRLELQSQWLVRQQASACLLADYLHYFPSHKELYWSDFSARGGMPGTIMFRAGLGMSYPETGPNARRREDTIFLQQLAARHKAVLLPEFGFLYVYVFHGANTWEFNHHVQMVSNFALPFAFVQARLDLLQAHVPVQMEKEFPVTLVCRGGEQIHFRSP